MKNYLQEFLQGINSLVNQTFDNTEFRKAKIYDSLTKKEKSKVVQMLINDFVLKGFIL